jgi:O-antigen/teichoic acid export membrane protein
VIRNTLFLVVAQVVASPISIVFQGVLARFLGPHGFGDLYVAWSYCTFGFLLADWGQNGALPALVTRDRRKAGEYLGSAIAWRVVVSLMVYGILALGCWLLGYDRDFQITLALVALATHISGVTQSYLDTARGFERTDFSAYAYPGQQLASVVFVLPVLMLGGRLHSMLVFNTASILLVLVLVARGMRSLRIGKVTVRREATKTLLASGGPFLFFAFAMALQPNLDTLLLSKLSTPEVVGWYATARKLVGVLIFPASALGSALYPTLCRYHLQNAEKFKKTMNGALRATTILAAPLALGCGLYPDLGVAIFGRQSYEPASDNLRVLAFFLLLVYLSVPIGVSLLAAGRQKAWAATQLICVFVSAALDPVLVPRFQRQMGNGGLGVCVASVLSEMVMVTGGILLMPRGVLDRAWVRCGLCTIASGVAMALAARLLSTVNQFIAAPLALLVYVVALWATGGLEKDHIQVFEELIVSKIKRKMGRIV